IPHCYRLRYRGARWQRIKFPDRHADYGLALDTWWSDKEKYLMGAYVLRRLLLIIPTLLGILLLNFAIVQAAPGGPVERMVAQLKSGAHQQQGGADSQFA